ncbi:MAG TPA: alcohol dehydrogenase catalytic domain-containing protein [Pyrinomonadaceae bacterium]|nr:alcohol dehydrogenase catalytic domain-containing protein [Pyrinomonadaceae bacterium]
MRGTPGDTDSSVSMQALVLCDVGRMELRDVPRPRTGARDALVRVAAVGLCGTDIHIFAGHANYHTDACGQPIPLTEHAQILGHEISGVVEEVGAEVTGLRAGDRVVIDQGLNCMSAARAPLCEYCATGDSHQCEFYLEHGITGLPGGLADYLAVPAVNAIRIDSDVDIAEAALTEPLSCIIHSSDTVASRGAGARYKLNNDDPERRVRATLICGAGPAGLLFIQYLRNVLNYDGLLLVAEPNDLKRALAESFGADTIDPRAVDLTEAVAEKTGGRRVEYLIEASGSGHVFSLIPGLIRKQATVLLYGHGHAGTDLSIINNVNFMEPLLVSAVGASGGFDADNRPTVYRCALRLISDNRIKVAPFITHRYASLDQVPDALASEHNQADYVKGVVTLG